MACSTDTTSFAPSRSKKQGTHDYVQSKPSDSRSPCPALNTLANHGYLPRDGKDIGFFELIHALTLVYNISWVLAVFLSIVAFSTSGKVVCGDSSKKGLSRLRGVLAHKASLPHLRLDLASLSDRGPKKIAHDASLVHPNFVPSHSPDERLLERLLSFAASRPHCSNDVPGLSLADIAHYHGKREGELHSPLDNLHEQIALGECGLAWAVMRNKLPFAQRKDADAEHVELISWDVLREWFGFERLPEDWWAEGGSRPVQSIGLIEAHGRAQDVAKLMHK